MEEAKYNGREIVITGMAGKFPKSSNVNVLRDNLYNKVDMVSEVDPRFSINHPSLPTRLGICEDMEYFDAQFFAVNYRQAISFEAMTRKLLEVACEAIIDSGVNPRSLRDSKTGVFVGSSLMESEAKLSVNTKQVDGYGLTGTARTMMSNRISYWLGARGPSYTIIGECCGSAVALEHAYHALATGQCEAAVVGGSNLCLEPTVALQVQWLNFSTYGSKTKCFCQDADGSVRSDSVVAIFLQKSKDAKRVYAQLVHAKSSHEGIRIRNDQYLFPSGENFGRFLKEFYTETDVRPEDVEYVEACSPAIKEADYEELQNIADVFCTDKRKAPIKVGCVKSNMGNSETSSTLVGLIKICLSYNNGVIPGNLHLDKPRTDVAAVLDGRIQLLDDHANFQKGYTAINSYSYVGICAHFLLKSFDINKVKDSSEASIPYLVCASGRVEKSLKNLFKDLDNKPIDVRQIRLLHNLYCSDIPGFVYRGYNILTTKMNTTVSLSKKADYYDGRQRPVWFVYSGMGSQWPTMGYQLIRIPIFAAAIQRCHTTLEPFGVDLTKILTDPDRTIFDNILHSFVGIAAIQIGLTDILIAIGIKPDYIIGHSVGELGCAYADGCLTAEEMILAAYYRGLVSIETPFIKGAMAAVGLGYNNAKPICPADVFIACHNGPESCTVSGPSSSVRTFVDVLKKRGIFAKEVACSDIAYHSKYIAEAGPQLQKYMTNVIKDPKPRSAKWVSSSVPQNQWDEPHAKLCSAEYLTNNLLNPVLFEEASRLIPDFAITIEIAPHGLLQAILKRSLPANCVHVPLTRRGHSDNAVMLLEAIGELSMNGLYPQVKNLYPAVEFPVPAETALLAHTTAWEHSEVWPMFAYQPPIFREEGERRIILTRYDKHLEYLQGHVVNGVNTLPAAAQLVLVWETLGFIRHVPYQDISVVFKNVRFCSDVVIPEETSVELTIMLQKGSGNFEIILQNAIVASGQINAINNVVDQNKKPKESPGDILLTSTDVYRLLLSRGYRYSGDFKTIGQVDSNFVTAEISWKDNWVTFLDGLIQLVYLNLGRDGTTKAKFLDYLEVDTKILKSAKLYDEKGCYITSCFSKVTNVLTCQGIRMEGLVTSHNESYIRKLQPSSMLTTIPTQLMDRKNIKLCFGNPGDFGSLTWVDAPVPDCKASETVQVHYARLGVSNLFLVQGRHDIICDDDTSAATYGFSYSGINMSGERVMGIIKGGAIASTVEVDSQLTWPVPQHWNLQEAASVPLAYIQALYLLAKSLELLKDPNSCSGVLNDCNDGTRKTKGQNLQNKGPEKPLLLKQKLVDPIVSGSSEMTQRAEVQSGMSVLVSQAGALGQAMISVCLSLNCRVFVCLKNSSSRDRILKQFPNLNEQDVSVSQDCNVIETILKGTSGEGCDIVISSASGYERQMLMQAVAPFGRFVDFGLLELEENAEFGMSYLWHGKSYKAVSFKSIFRDDHYAMRKIFRNAIHRGICEGWVKPLTSVVYDPHNIRQAFHVLNARKSSGAVLVNMKNLTKLDPAVTVISQWRCDKDHTYIVVSDQDGLAVEIIDKLVRSGAKKIVIHTQDPGNGFLKVKLRSIVNANIVLNTEDLKTENGCEKMLSAAENLGPIAAIFVVCPNFKTNTVSPVTYDFVFHLDKIYRKYGARKLVILSPSVEENDEQLNIRNVLTSLCVDRTKHGYHAKVIYCNASHVLDKMEEIEGLTIAIREIAEELDLTMASNEPFVNTDLKKVRHELQLIDILNILGLNTLQKEDLNKPLCDLSIDLSLLKLLSMDLKQHNNIYYTPEILMKMSLRDITEDQTDQTILPEPTTNPFGQFFSFYDNDYEKTMFEPLVWMETLGYSVEGINRYFECYNNQDYLIVLPGMDGLHLTMTRVCRRLNIRALLYQYTDLNEGDTVGHMAEYIVKNIKRRIGLGNRFYLLGHNFGALLALEMAAVLEKQGNQGTVFCLDSSPMAVKTMIEHQTQDLSVDEQQNLLLEHTCHLMLKNKPIDNLKLDLKIHKNWESKLDCALKWLKYENSKYFEYTKTILNLALKRINQAKNYESNFEKLTSKIVLIKGCNDLGLPDDYGLSNLSENVAVRRLKADHLNIVYDLRCSDLVNRELNVA